MVNISFYVVVKKPFAGGSSGSIKLGVPNIAMNTAGLVIGY
jgi:hypothetical protein